MPEVSNPALTDKTTENPAWGQRTLLVGSPTRSSAKLRLESRRQFPWECRSDRFGSLTPPLPSFHTTGAGVLSPTGEARQPACLHPALNGQ